jgi:hypothetical protein
MFPAHSYSCYCASSFADEKTNAIKASFQGVLLRIHFWCKCYSINLRYNELKIKLFGNSNVEFFNEFLIGFSQYD